MKRRTPDGRSAKESDKTQSTLQGVMHLARVLKPTSREFVRAMSILCDGIT